MELALAVLLVCSFTCVGLLALWAATSERHWFVRTSVVLAVLVPLLAVPAYEPFVVFVLQATVVCAGVGVVTLVRRGSRKNVGRFRLSNLLFAVVIFSVATAVATKLPSLNWLAWQSVVLMGCCLGVATLLSHWIVQGERPHWCWRVLAGFFLAINFSLPLIYGDWFVISVLGYNGWPPERIGFQLSSPRFTEDDAILFWIPIVIFTVGFVATFAHLAAGAYAATEHNERSRYRWTTAALMVFGAFFLVPGVYVFYRLMTPQPIPQQKLPKDNGLKHLLAAGRLAENSQFESGFFDAETVPLDLLHAAVEEMEAAYTELQIGLAKPTRLPVNYTSPFGFQMEEIQLFRALARCIDGRAILAVREGRVQDAFSDHLDNIRLGYAFRPKTLIVNGFVGIAISGIGRSGVYDLTSSLDHRQSQEVIELLLRLDKQAEPVESFFDRERIFAQHSNGWHGHFLQILFDVSDPDRFTHKYSTKLTFDRERAITRLICTEIAIQRYRRDFEKYPESLAALVPKYLPQTLEDPFSLSSDAFPYRLEDGEFVLYSVGTDGEDDGGILPLKYDEPRIWFMRGGDLRLKDYYAPYLASKEEDGRNDDAKLYDSEGE